MTEVLTIWHQLHHKQIHPWILLMMGETNSSTKLGFYHVLRKVLCSGDIFGMKCFSLTAHILRNLRQTFSFLKSYPI